MATLMLSRGESLPAVSARLGHKDATTTLANYAHAMPTDAHRLARASEIIFTELSDTR
jgi:integrase